MAGREITPLEDMTLDEFPVPAGFVCNSLGQFLDYALTSSEKMVYAGRSLWRQIEARPPESHVRKETFLTRKFAECFYSHLLKGRPIRTAAKLCFMPWGTLDKYRQVGLAQADTLLSEPLDDEGHGIIPLSRSVLFVLESDYYIGRYLADKVDQVEKEALKDPKLTFVLMQMLERLHHEDWGKRSVVKQEVKQEIVVTFKEADGEHWVTGSAAPIRQIVSADGVIASAFLPDHERDDDAEDEEL